MQSYFILTCWLPLITVTSFFVACGFVICTSTPMQMLYSAEILETNTEVLIKYYTWQDSLQQLCLFSFEFDNIWVWEIHGGIE